MTLHQIIEKIRLTHRCQADVKHLVPLHWKNVLSLIAQWRVCWFPFDVQVPPRAEAKGATEIRITTVQCPAN